MSQAPTPSPYGQPAANAPVDRRPTNGLGIAGFVVSLVGILSCGALSPIGLILSLFALMKRPRGFAIAGTVISFLGVGLLVIVVSGLVAAAKKGGEAVEAIGKGFESQVALSAAASSIEQHRIQNGVLPDDEIGQQLIVEFKDAYGNGLHYERLSDDEFEIRSAGLDGTFHTADDMTNENFGGGVEFNDADEASDPFGDE